MRLCTLEDLPDGGARGFDTVGEGQSTLFVVRRGDAVYAYRDWCPHQGVPMAWRKDAYLNGDRTRIVCAAHGAQFEIETGRCTLGPCLGDSLQPVAVQVDASGMISIAPFPGGEDSQSRRQQP